MKNENTKNNAIETTKTVEVTAATIKGASKFDSHKEEREVKVKKVSKFDLAKPAIADEKEWDKEVRKAVRESLEKESIAELLAVHGEVLKSARELADENPIPSGYSYVLNLTNHADKTSEFSVTLKAIDNDNIMASMGGKVNLTLTNNKEIASIVNGYGLNRKVRKGYELGKDSKEFADKEAQNIISYLTTKQIVGMKWENLSEKMHKRIIQSIASMLIYTVNHNNGKRIKKPTWLTIPKKDVVTVIKNNDTSNANVEEKAC